MTIVIVEHLGGELGDAHQRALGLHCGQRFTTFERIQLRELTIIKSSGAREPLDRELARSMRIALRKRPVDPERVELVVNGIIRRLEGSGETEVRSEDIGQLIMDALANLDQVAYVRFASVYRNFREAGDFETFLDAMRPDDGHEDDEPARLTD